MIGFPKHLNSRQDYENCHRMARGGLLERQKMIDRWQALIDGAKQWVFKAVVSESYKAGKNEKVMAEPDMQANKIKYTCFELLDNPNAAIYQLAYTVTTVNQKIAELEV
jgi:hypothetical protein